MPMRAVGVRACKEERRGALATTMQRTAAAARERRIATGVVCCVALVSPPTWAATSHIDRQKRTHLPSEIDRSIDRTPKRARAVLVRACSASRPPERHPAFRACCCCLLSSLPLDFARNADSASRNSGKGASERQKPTLKPKIKSRSSLLLLQMRLARRSGDGACGLLRWRRESISLPMCGLVGLSLPEAFGPGPPFRRSLSLPPANNTHARSTRRAGTCAGAGRDGRHVTSLFCFGYWFGHGHVQISFLVGEGVQCAFPPLCGDVAVPTLLSPLADKTGASGLAGSRAK